MHSILVEATTPPGAQEEPPEGRHKALIRSLPQRERDRLGQLAGVSGTYITALVYRANTVSLPIAIAVDKYTQGEIDFRSLLFSAGTIDWDFVREKLNKER
jgi:hypothetical protein